ncbi:MAG: hypothetical protein FJW32_25150 [Acidobacteria bacterium]|nr:hypothetical protein [Acidobacteriota bacterium]
MLNPASLIARLGDPREYPLEEAELHVRSLMAEGRRVPERFALALQAEPPPPPASTDRMLELMRRVTPLDRLVQLLDKVIPSSNADIRAKARKLYEALTADLSWAEPFIRGNSGRDAADLVEALWRVVPSDSLRAIFIAAAAEPHNRLAGNALVGLFRLGDQEARDAVLSMTRHEEEPFRATAAWVIGRVSWHGGATRLQEMTSDPSEKVRRNARRALGRLNRFLREAA